jgi:ADP-ribosylglycohydrolase
MTHITSTSSSTHDETVNSKGSTTPAPMTRLDTIQQRSTNEDSEARDYELFLEKAKKDAEKAEKMKLKEIREADRRRREVNLSPWGGRM